MPKRKISKAIQDNKRGQIADNEVCSDNDKQDESEEFQIQRDKHILIGQPVQQHRARHDEDLQHETHAR